MRLPENLEVLRLRELRLLLLGQGISVVGDRMVAVALAFAVLEVGGSPSEVGLVLASATVTMVASVLVGGVVADRVSRRAVMLAADVARVATQGTMALLLVAGAAEVWMLAVLAGLTGVATGFFNPASTALLPEIVAPRDLQPANALRSTTVAAGEIGGPIAAGVLVAVAGAGWAIAADAATFAVSGLCLALLRLGRRPARAPSSFLADLREGWDALRARRWLWSVLAYFAVVNMLWASWSALGPIVADRELGGADAWGFVLGGFGIGALLGGLVATRIDPARPLVVIALVEGLFMLPLVALASGAGVPLLVVGTVLSGGSMTVGIALWMSTLQRNVPSDALSRLSSFDWFASFAFYPVGLALWGPIAGALGVTAALWLAAGLFAVSIAALLALPDVWRLQAAAGSPSG